ncbi:hypothetical protein ANN_17118 [Periplaneta americana]|uniref:Uncharacterized protein n=1 Tax=Periplaneta americana TaxID=6978 RepID=A0ABQ8ST86_PERAM|nr:hypothetical protein ANN_17118 [Periplaneta americana]
MAGLCEGGNQPPGSLKASELYPQQVGEVEAIRLSHKTVVRKLQYHDFVWSVKFEQSRNSVSGIHDLKILSQRYRVLSRGQTREIERQYIVRDSENDRDSFIISVDDSDSEGSSSDEI